MEVYLVRLNDYGTSADDKSVICIAQTIEAGQKEVKRQAISYGYYVFDSKEKADVAIKEDGNEDINWVFLWDDEEDCYNGYEIDGYAERGLVEDYDSKIEFEVYSVK